MTFLLLLGLVFILYSTSLHGDWLFDDFTGVLANTPVLARKFYFDWKQPRYLLWLSYIANARWLGRLYAHQPIPAGQFPEPVGFHVVNMAIHAVNAWLVSWIAEMLAPGIGFWTGIVFAVHPLAVNAVASISGRSSSLSGTFYFLSLGCALHGWIVPAIVAMGAALWTKEDTITLLPLLIIITIFFTNRHELIWIYPVCIICAGVGLKHYRSTRHKSGRSELDACGYPPSAVSDREYPRTVFTETILRFPQWIVGRNLQIDAEVQPSSRWRFMAACGVFLAAVAVMIHFIHGPIGFGILFILCSPALAYLCFILPDPIAEHRAYVSLLGASILLGMLSSITFGTVLLGIAICYFATLTIKRQHAWTTGIRLFTQNYADGARHPRVFINLNWAYQQIGDYAKAEEWAQEALKRAPHSISVHLNRAESERLQGRVKTAIALLSTEMAFTPRALAGWKQLAMYCEQDQDWRQALLCYVRAIPLAPEPEMFNQAGSLFWRLGDPGTAQFFFAGAHALNVHNPAFRYNLGMIALSTGKVDQARQWLATIPHDAPVPTQLRELLA